MEQRLFLRVSLYYAIVSVLILEYTLFFLLMTGSYHFSSEIKEKKMK